MTWILIIIATSTLPLQFPTENPYAMPPHTVTFESISGFQSRETCEYTGKFFREQMRRKTKCVHT